MSLGASVQFFLDIAGGRLPIYYVKELASKMLHALEFIHSAQVIHSGPTPLIHFILWFTSVTLDL